MHEETANMSTSASASLADMMADSLRSLSLLPDTLELAIVVLLSSPCRGHMTIKPGIEIEPDHGSLSAAEQTTV